MNCFTAKFSLSARLQIVKKWINECCRNHAICGAQGPQRLPRRVLDLRAFAKSGTLSLHETSGESAFCACLTHCWGSEMSCRTTTASISSIMRDIPWNSVPQNFKDAVLVASKLRIPFLWIDALCIIQGADAQQDWEEQSAAMAEIYGNAYLTIVASNSASSAEGFLSKRRKYEPPLRFRGHSVDAVDSPGLTVYARRPYDHSLLDGHRSTEGMRRINVVRT